MSVYRLKDGRWICRYEKGKDPERPNTTRKYFGRGPEAEKAAIEFNASLGLGRYNKKQSPTFTELANEYITAKKNSMTPAGLDRVCNRIGSVIVPEIGNIQAHMITPSILDGFVNERRKKVKSTTVRNDLSVIRTIMKWAVKRRLIASNPMDGYELPKKDDARIMPPTREEIDAIAECASPHVRRAILLSYYTGLRPGKTELLSLTWDNVDLINRTLMVISASKGGIPLRMVPLNKTIVAHMKEWHADDSKEGVKYIIHYRGRKISSLRHGWAMAKKRAGITRRIRMYDLRHAAITTLLERGADLKSVSEIAGHASPDITMKVYQHVSSELKRATVDLLD